MIDTLQRERLRQAESEMRADQLRAAGYYATITPTYRAALDAIADRRDLRRRELRLGDDDSGIVAVHEAGHAVTAQSLGIRVTRLDVLPSGKTRGRVRHDTTANVQHDLTIGAGGVAATGVIFPRSIAALDWGLDGGGDMRRLRELTSDPAAEPTHPAIVAALGRATSIVRARRGDVVFVAVMLHQFACLDEDMFLAALERAAILGRTLA